MAIKKLIILLGSYLACTGALANPVLNNATPPVNATVQQSPGLTVINQTGQKAILNWHSFNIDVHETTQFQQPAGGIALNRISPLGGASQIYGRLLANGRIILINPAGIYFGPTAYVNVGGLIATTANITDQNFMSGNYHFQDLPGANGTIQNDGRIIVEKNGLAALVAPNVVNNGVIQANLGTVVLGSAQAFTVDFGGDGLVNFKIDQGVEKSGRIENTGALIANGGKVLVSAKAAAGVLDQSINMKGIVQAKSVYKKNGAIIFSADPNVGVVKVAAKIKATGKYAGQKGGKVQITGKKILVDSGSKIDVSGDAGGGEILIGGNFQGKGPLPNASAVVLAANTILNADAITKGNGGNIILWSDDLTKAYGTLSARGGVAGGDGGLIETSGKYLDVNGIEVNTSAPKGKTGTWLLDPTDLFITNNGGVNVNILNPSSNVYEGDANQSISILDATNLQNYLNANNVIVQTTTGGSGSGLGDISVDAPITWSSGNTLTLDAAHYLYLNADITALNGGLILSTVDPAFVFSTPTILSGTAASPSPSGVTANINVKDFSLTRGIWYQVSPALPVFDVTNNFYLNIPASLNMSTIGFTRALGGDGTSIATAFQITDIYGLEGVGSNNLRARQHHILMNSIDASNTVNWTGNGGTGFFPIGGSNFNNGLVGYFDGQNQPIKNLYINYPGGRNVGFIGVLANYGGAYIGIAKNINLINVNVTGGDMTGGVVGYVTHGGNLSNSSVSGIVTGNVAAVLSAFNSVGGLVGTHSNSGIISNSYSTANVFSTSTYNRAGGLVGHSSSTIIDSYATGAVSVTGSSAGASSSVGGLVGLQGGGSITDSYSIGPATLTTLGMVGGLVGEQTSGIVTDSFWDVDMSGLSISAAGVGKTTAEMKMLSTYTGGGVTWSINNSPNAGFTWNIIDGISYPFLYIHYPTTPRVISGSFTAGTSGEILSLISNGSQLSSGSLGNNLVYYFLAALMDNQTFIAYSDTTSGNLIAKAPVGGGSLIGINFIPNTIQVGDTSSNTYTLSDISTALGGITSPDILMSASGSTLTIGNATNPNVNLTTTPTTTLSLISDESINTFSPTSTGNFTFNGPVSAVGLLPASINSADGNQIYNNTFSVSKVSALTLTGNMLTFNNGIGGSAANPLNLNAVNVTINGALPSYTINVTGTSANNQLAVDTGSAQFWNISGGNSGNLNLLNFSNIQNLVGGIDDDTFALGAAGSIMSVNGIAGTDTLSLSNAGPNTWNITGVDVGNITGLVNSFSNIDTLQGSGGDDNFVLAVGGSFSGSILGGFGLNSITNNNPGVIWTFTGFQQGNLTNVGSFSNIVALNGSGTDTLVGDNNNNTWTISTPNAGSNTFGNPFTGMMNLTGGSGDDSYQLTGTGSLTGSINGGLGNNSLTANNVVNAWVINGADTGTVTGLGAGFSNIGSLIGGTTTDTFTFSNGSLSGSIEGNNQFFGANTIVGNNTATTWTITSIDNTFGAIAGNMTNLDAGFNNIHVLTGGSDNDDFIVNASSGTSLFNTVFNGGGGVNSLTANNAGNNVWTITGANAGTLIGNADVTFTGIQLLTGNSNADTFNLNGNTFNGSIAGGGGTDTLNANNVVNNWVITGLDTGTVGGILGIFSSIENLVGGSNNDNFTLSGGTVSGNINGNGGTNTITADNVANIWNINFPTSSVTGVNSFNLIQNLIGGSNNDDFNINASLGGSINGNGGVNTLTVNTGNFAYTFWGINGPNSGTQSDIVGGFSDIQSLIGGNDNDVFGLAAGITFLGTIDGAGGTDNIIEGGNTNTTWSLTGLNTGTVTGLSGNFSNIQHLVGNAANDDFTLAGGSLDGPIEGGGGANALTAANIANIFTITGSNSGSVTGITGGFIDIQDLIGGNVSNQFILNGGTLTGSIMGVGSNNTLTAGNVVNTFNITGANMGMVTGVTGGFSNIQNLVGGNNNNSFVFADGASIDNIVGGASILTTNTLDYAAYLSDINIALIGDINTGQTMNQAATVITNFSNINNLVANGAQNNNLSLPNKANTVTITGPDPGPGPTTGFINDPTFFSGFNSLTSTSGFDTVIFNVPSSNSGGNSFLIGGNTLTFIGFNFASGGDTSISVSRFDGDIASIVQEPLSEKDNVMDGDEGYVADNIDSLLDEIQKEYDVNLSKLKINPYCQG